MDRFSEQLTPKVSTGKDMFLRGCLIAAAMAIIGALVYFLGLFFGMWLVAVCLSGTVIWGLVWLLQGTFVEYEYIVTNDDLDIDKIIGRRKRKRLITVSLAGAKQIGEYSSGDEIDASVTVMAHDQTGVDMYCFVCGTKDYGDVAIIFNPDKRTLYNMIGGFSPAVKNKYSELYAKLKPAVPQEDEEEPAEDEPASETTAMEE